jgi:hypothetical protein
MRTPWGAADYVTEILEGVHNVSTPSHGGIKLSRERNAAIPDYMRKAGGWYEEDCDWCIPFVAFEAEIRARGDEYPLKALDKGQHTDTLKNWHPDAYEKFYSITLQPGESYKRDQKLFELANAQNLVGVAAWGDWQAGVPKGMVGVLATLGGTRAPGRTEHWFVVPQDEYEARNHFGFVIDEARHAHIDPIA